MTPMARRRSPCPGCRTCRPLIRDRWLVAAVIVVFVAVFVLRLAVPS
jgi:hypothetical protein